MQNDEVSDFNESNAQNIEMSDMQNAQPKIGKRRQKNKEDLEREELMEYKKLELENILKNKEEQVIDEEVDSDGISEVDPDDFGYYSIFHTGWGDCLEKEEQYLKEKENERLKDPKKKKKKKKKNFRNVILSQVRVFF